MAASGEEPPGDRLRQALFSPRSIALSGSLSMCIVGLPAGLAIYQLAVGIGKSPSSAVVDGFAYYVMFLQAVVWMPVVSGVCGAFVAREGWRRANERQTAQQ